MNAANNHRETAPATDIYETHDALILLANLPGVAEKDLNITLEKDVLTLEGKQTTPARPGYDLAYGEYDPVDFRRVFTLSTDVKRDAIEATLRDGVLKLVLPKVEPLRAHKIAVKAG